jgi:hypothetical protein
VEQFVTAAKRKKGRIEDIKSITIKTESSVAGQKETLATFFLWSMEHDGVLKEVCQ